MILVIDVGNTNITFGVYEGKKLVTTFRMMSKLPHTSDEYGMSIRQLLMFDGISKEQIEGTILASVVPNIMHSLVGGITRYLGTPHCGSRHKDRYPHHHRKPQGNRPRPYCRRSGGL